MMQLLETICLENNEFQRLSFHNERLNRSRRDIFNLKDEIRLEDFLHAPIGSMVKKTKCRVIYDKSIKSIEFQPYSIREIRTLKMINADQIEYSYKYLDRSQLGELLKSKGSSDEILIVKEGSIREISFANIVFLKNGIWITPDNPLLKGTRREYYIRQGSITASQITPSDLKEFSEARIINAMISIEESPIIPIENILF